MINLVVEGASDEQMARAVVRSAGRSVNKVVVKNGKTRLDPLIANYNRAAVHAPWVVFRDSDTQCPKRLRAMLTSGIDEWSPLFLLRLVHPMSEPWLMADRDAFARYFGVRVAVLPADPESLASAKQTLLHVCAGSRSREIRLDMVTRDGRVGPLYTARLNDYARTAWDAEAGALRCDSLRRAVERIRELPRAMTETLIWSG